jgi:major membrane immunogen (membrane-anchored lipoprotein)
MNWRLMAAVLMALSLLAAAGCGESQQVTVFKQGQYQGKADARPWDGGEFKGNKGAWENAINTRTLGQNEYVRITGGG